MARAVGLGSQFRGRIGSYVGYLSKDSRGRYVQSVKSYQPIVANPQTFAQCLARIPLAPTQRFFAALSPLIQRGFEGVAFGDPSKAEYLSYNLANFRGPYLTRSDLKPRPGPFLVAQGSLASVLVQQFYNDGDNIGFVTSLRLPTALDFSTIGDLSRALLDNNINLRQGEQLTFVWCSVEDDEYNYYWRSFFVNPDDDTIAEYWVNSNGRLLFLAGDISDYGDIYGGCVIRSQPSGSDAYKRSTTFFQLNLDYYQYNDDTALIDAIRSYMDAGDLNEDWPYDPTPEGARVANICLVTVTDQMVAGTDLNDFTNAKCLGYLRRDGQVGIFFSYFSAIGRNVLLNAAAQPLSAFDGDTTNYALFNDDYTPSMEYTPNYGVINS